jgi:DNA-binding transcriptional MerR regulator
MLTVGQVAKRLGLRVSAVHFYERRGLLPPVPRVRGQRRYSEAHLRRLTFLAICQHAGLSLDDIAVMLTAEPDVWHCMVRDRIVQIEADLVRLEDARQTLAGSLRCPADHPADQCPYVQSAIDARLGGG